MAPADSTNGTIYYPGGNFFMNFTLEKALDSISFSGNNLDGYIINARSPIAVFVGQGCSGSASAHPGSNNTTICDYLWEQAVRVEKFAQEFVLVNPNAGHEGNSGNSTTTIRLLNGATFPVFVDVSGLTKPYPIRLQSAQAIAIDTTNITNIINSTGPIDVQIVTDYSLESGNRTQWGLIPNNQFINQAYFFVQNSTQNQLSLVALTSDVKNSSSSLKFNNKSFDLSLFKVSANSSYSYVITKPQNGTNIMKSSFNLAGYLFPNKANTTNFGSVIGRNL